VARDGQADESDRPGDLQRRAKRRYLAAESREECTRLLELPEWRRLDVSNKRSALNRYIIKPLSEGWLPNRALASG
jgi:hypothetical protein